MSKLRKLRRGLQVPKIKVAYALEHMTKVAGSFAAVKENFPAVFEKAFTYETQTSSTAGAEVAETPEAARLALEVGVRPPE